MKRDVILTGIPRSGTTLACYLLNKLPNVVALNEPMDPVIFEGKSTQTIVKMFKDFFECQRESLLASGFAESRTVDGLVIDNHMGEALDPGTGRRVCLLNSHFIRVQKPLEPSFLLLVKHPNFYAALLEWLKEEFECFAIVRNPLSVLLSWNTVNIPSTDGSAGSAEPFDKRLTEELRGEPDNLSKQMFILSWHFKKYIDNLPLASVIRYEEIIETGGKALSAITREAASLNETLITKNNSDLYDHSAKGVIADRLLKDKNSFFWKFYTREEIVALL